MKMISNQATQTSEQPSVLLARQLADTQLTDNDLLGATRVAEQYCDTIFAQQNYLLKVKIENYDEFSAIPYLYRPLSSICSVTSDAMVIELPASAAQDVLLQPPDQGWPCGELQISYTAGYQTPTQQDDGNVPPDLARAVKIIALHIQTLDAAPNIPKVNFSSFGVDYENPKRAIPQSAMTILQRYKVLSFGV